MKSFGGWDTGIQHTATPVGAPCIRCDETIAEGDSGVVMPHLAEDGPQTVAQHRECHLRNVFGSVGHQLGRCSCYGGTEEDPPGMTRREAARAAMALAESRLGRGRTLV